MNNQTNSDERSDSGEIEELLRKLSGRVACEIIVVNGRTGNRDSICSYDFDFRDSTEIVFTSEEIPKEDATDDGEGPGKIVYTFCIDQKPGEEVETDMAAKPRNVSQKALDEFQESLTKANPTCEDYLHNSDIQFSDLSEFEKCRVLEHDLDNLLDMFDSYGYSEAEKKPGLLKKIFCKKTSA